MTDQVLGNYLRTQRRSAGLSQREIGRLLGYRNHWQVSRHERSRIAPPLLTALAYEAIFRVPVAALFTGMYDTVARVIEGNLVTLERDILAHGSSGHLPIGHAKKLRWLNDRKAALAE